MKRIKKSTLLSHHNCPRLAHLAMSEGGAFAGGDFFMREGIDITIKAAEFFGADITIGNAAPAEEAARLTDVALNEGKLVAEATFIGTDEIVRCDLARRDENGIAFTEVKSGIYKSGNIAKNVNDVAAQIALLERAGHCVVRAELALLNPAAVGPQARDLFSTEDITTPAVRAAKNLDVDAIIATLSAASPPPQVFCGFCRKCDFFGKCWPEYPSQFATVNIPNMKYIKLEKLHNSGVFDGRDAGDMAILSPKQQAVVACWRRGEPDLDVAGFEANFPELPAVGGRLHFLDIEAARPSIPLFADHKPYTLVPFQFSLHTAVFTGEDAMSIEQHRDFLHLEESDPTPFFLEALINMLSEDDNKIVVYSSYEKSGLKAAVESAPQFADAVDQIIARFVDLYKGVSQNLFHPKMNGSSSIKAALPAFKPESAYGNLSVQDGIQAVETWAALRGQAAPDAQKRDDMLKYCGRDTEAMIHVLEGILRLRSGRTG